MKRLTTYFQKTYIQLLIIFTLTFLVFANTLANGIVWDDHLFIEQWPVAQNILGMPAIFAGSAPVGQGGIYRPVRGILYIVDNLFFGQTALLYHLQALFIHLGVTFLIYWITKLLTKRKGLAFGVALLFALHPIHTETIDYIAASMETWGTLFFFSAIYFYIKAIVIERSTRRLSRVPDGIRRSNLIDLRFYIISCVLAFFAFFTYELTLILPLLLLLIDVSFNKFPKKLTARFFLPYLPYAFLATFYFFIRMGILHIVSRNAYLGYSFFLTIQVMVKVFARYIGLLLFPMNLTANHNLVGNFPDSMLPYDKLDPILHQSITDPSFLFSAFILISLLVLSIIFFKRYTIFSFAVLWFFITLLPVANIIPSGSLMSEKFLYIPSFGFLLLLVDSIAKLFQLAYKKKVISKQAASFWLIFVLVIAFVYGGLTVFRNSVWKSDITLFSDMVEKSPTSLIGHYTLGVKLQEIGDLNEAAKQYETAVQLAPDFWQAHNNLGNIYFKMNQQDLATKEYLTTLTLNPNAPTSNTLRTRLQRFSSFGQGNAGIQANTLWKKATFENISFSYPDAWQITTTSQSIELTDPAAAFHIVFIPSQKSTVMTVDAYVATKTASYGTITKQGSALIPAADVAYVRFWQESEITLLQFFLFKDDRVVEVRLTPATSTFMPTFDAIMKTITF